MNADTNSFRQYVKGTSTAAKSPTRGKANTILTTVLKRH